ncbi:MAG TPA: polysaccharide deacetylase family protein [Candidatus Methylacidiphilales bacterium]|nr:polysaccharide deacetylase family protein [Candidatus Methylacidiphilales bacterium]
MSVTRGQFLKSLGASAGNAAFGIGLAAATRILGGKLTVKLEPLATAAAPDESSVFSFLESGPPEGNRIALTFEDGPTPGVTEPILDRLKERGLTATFFMIGQHAAAAPELARRILAESHTVGNHTYTHPKLTELPGAQAESELVRTQDTLAEILNHRPAIFRPPYGSFRKNQSGLARSLGLRVVLWSVDSRDWTQPGADQIIDAILAQTKAGSIILCHDLHHQTADCLGRVLDQLLERQYHFVPVTAFLDDAPANGPAGI